MRGFLYLFLTGSVLVALWAHWKLTSAYNRWRARTTSEHTPTGAQCAAIFRTHHGATTGGQHHALQLTEFADYRLLKGDFGAETAKIPAGAIGVYSYLNRLSTGLRQLMALNRKFALRFIGREDILPLTDAAAKASGLPTYEELTAREV